ncbi:MAG: hypothetical protein ACREOZ_03785 [Gloeomargaritales cyanobacterium]
MISQILLPTRLTLVVDNMCLWTVGRPFRSAVLVTELFPLPCQIVPSNGLNSRRGKDPSEISPIWFFFGGVKEGGMGIPPSPAATART